MIRWWVGGTMKAKESDEMDEQEAEGRRILNHPSHQPTTVSTLETERTNERNN